MARTVSSAPNYAGRVTRVFSCLRLSIFFSSLFLTPPTLQPIRRPYPFFFRLSSCIILDTVTPLTPLVMGRTVDQEVHAAFVEFRAKEDDKVRDCVFRNISPSVTNIRKPVLGFVHV